MDMSGMAPGAEKSSRALVRLEQVHLRLPLLGKPGAVGRAEPKVGGLIRRLGSRAYVEALLNVDLTLSQGDRLAVLGHNGAGKTSLMRTMAGIYEPSSGTCSISGRVSALFSSTIGMSPLNTGRMNIRQACAMFQVPRSAMADFERDVIEFSELGDFVDLPVSTYSAGMRTRLGFSIVSGLDPEILIIDEVLSAGDLAFARKAQERIMAMIDRSHALVVASHSASLIRLFCNRAIWLDRGQIRMDGPFEEVWRRYHGDSAARRR